MPGEHVPRNSKMNAQGRDHSLLRYLQKRSSDNVNAVHKRVSPALKTRRMHSSNKISAGHNKHSSNKISAGHNGHSSNKISVGRNRHSSSKISAGRNRHRSDKVNAGRNGSAQDSPKQDLTPQTQHTWLSKKTVFNLSVCSATSLSLSPQCRTSSNYPQTLLSPRPLPTHANQQCST
ncbi:hypothetical protein BS50DRAFT_588333 [Corynespora cassiicola Philippines]|uniref:Uncharacterized protein n=1 Tax=Corynespora cassiicola Philippines TaxID=1448308 RepID=A0A2T2NQ22_CORCC|nr:hypothetical protein BS50DRAFT_588333 [Corynespora cassiicola Philippines]